MNNFESNKKIAVLIVDLVSKIYKLGDGLLVKFELIIIRHITGLSRIISAIDKVKNI